MEISYARLFSPTWEDMTHLSHDTCTSRTYSPDGQIVAVGFNNGHVTGQASDGKVLRTLQGKEDTRNATNRINSLLA